MPTQRTVNQHEKIFKKVLDHDINEVYSVKDAMNVIMVIEVVSLFMRFTINQTIRDA